MNLATTTIIAKDLRQRLRDGTILVFGVVLPLGMAFMFSVMLGGGQNPAFAATYAVADLDRGSEAAAFTQGVLEPMRAHGNVKLVQASSAGEANRLVDERKAHAAFIIPAGFSAALQRGEPATLQVAGNPDASIAMQVAREVAEAFAIERRAVQLAAAASGGRLPPPPDLAQRVQQITAPLNLTQDDTVTRRQLDTTTFYAAGMAIFFLFYVAMLSVIGIFEERRSGTMARLLAAPISRRAVLIAKSLSGVVVGLGCMALLVGLSTQFLGARWGPPLGVAVMVVCGVLAVTGITLAVATFAANAEQASNWLSIVTMALGILGGALIPLGQLGAFEAVGYVTPHYWFLYGLSELAGGGSLGVVLLPALVLLGLAAVGGGIALARVGRMLHA
ncbi:ABC-2 type transport system permease protein [Sinosporangium album]|uniref:ABC-2 type transport system permease protein n=1 Tax=Sinosporangium album TaxID=504805 RepID=A0A1G8GIV3_9ACTN|nr:ABC transporter permease [Sinosporangium album]SDH94266.1 ABC-2 type transport system permease protein [Sinosporangium album]